MHSAVKTNDNQQVSVISQSLPPSALSLLTKSSGAVEHPAEHAEATPHSSPTNPKILEFSAAIFDGRLFVSLRSSSMSLSSNTICPLG